MHYGRIKNFDISNGPGVRVSLFVSGCRNRCKGCFQPETWDFRYGEEFAPETFRELLRLLDNDNIDGLSILGGDPFEPENIGTVTAICEHVKKKYPNKTIWIWTGYNWENLKDLEIMQYIDVLIDGPFIRELKDLRLQWRGSSNQRVIDIQESNKQGCAIRHKGKEDWK